MPNAALTVHLENMKMVKLISEGIIETSFGGRLELNVII